MESTARPSKELRFGPFQFDHSREKLLRNGVAVRLQDQPLKLLLLLIERNGEVVSREEMRTRLWPADMFGDFDNGLNVAIKKLRTALGDDPEKPLYIETIPRRGYRFISTITEPHPGVIQAMASDSAACVVAGHPSSLPGRSSVTPQEHRPQAASGQGPALKRVLVALIAMGLVLAGGIWLLRTKTHPPSARVDSNGLRRTSRRSVAVLGFRNSSGRNEDAWLSTALSEMLSTELAAGDHLRLIPGEDVVQFRLVQPSSYVGSVSRTTARQLRSALNADLIVSGSYVAIGENTARQVRVDVRLQDTASGEILTEVSDSGTEPGLFQMVGNVGERLRQKLGVSGTSVEQHAQIMASMPANREAGEFFSKGLLKLREYDALSARDLLQQSIAAQPSFPLSHSALSEVWARLGYDRRALDEAQKASQLSSVLLPTERIQIQARYWEATRDWEKAAEAYRLLRSSFPDDREYGIRLAHSLVQVGKGQEAVVILDALRGHSDPGMVSAQIYLAIAEAYVAIGSLDHAMSASLTAETAARAQGHSLLLARALRTEGLIHENLSEFDKAIAAAEESRHIYQEAGDRFGVASVFEVEGNTLTDRGNLAEALDKYQTELKIVREIGNKRGEASALNNIALVHYLQGDLKPSRAMWEEAEAVFRVLGDRSNTAIVIVNIGGVLKDQGDLAAASLRYQQALAMSREIHDPSGEVLALHALGTTLDAIGDYANARKSLQQANDINLAKGLPTPDSESLLDMGDVQRHRGNLKGARKTYEDALSASRKTGEKSWTAYALFDLGRVAFLSANFSEANADYNQALQIRRELGETFNIAETEMAIAETAMRQDPSKETLPVLTRVRDTFRMADKQDHWIAATVLISQRQIAEGKRDEAKREFATLPQSGKIQEAESRWAVEILQGQLLAADGKHTDAQRIFRSVIQDAESRGALEESLRARLTFEETTPENLRWPSELDRLLSDASHAGYELIVQRIQAIKRSR